MQIRTCFIDDIGCVFLDKMRNLKESPFLFTKKIILYKLML